MTVNIAARVKIAVAIVSSVAVSSALGTSAILDRIASAPENSWVKVNNNLFSDAWPDPDDRPMRAKTNAPPSKIILAWSSFAWDSNRSSMWLYGGGHANYNGNEVYRFNGRTLLWERASMPSAVTLTGSHYIPVDGAMNAPQSAHTYDNTVFLKTADRMMTFGGADSDGGGSFKIRDSNGNVRPTGPYLFDPNKADANKVGGTTGSNVQRVNGPRQGGQMWSNRDSDFVAGKRTFINGTTDVVSDETGDTVYVTSRYGGTSPYLFRYKVVDADDPSTDSWSLIGIGWEGYSDQGAGAFNPDRQLYVRTANQRFPFFYYWDLGPDATTNRDRPATFDAPADFVMDRDFGFDYDPVRDQFLMWSGAGDVWSLDVPENLSDRWTVTKAYADGTNDPAVTRSTGVLGKWKYAEELDAFIALSDSVEGNVWAYKPLGWVNPVAAIPEASTSAMMIAGLALIGIVARRRTKLA